MLSVSIFISLLLVVIDVISKYFLKIFHFNRHPYFERFALKRIFWPQKTSFDITSFALHCIKFKTVSSSISKMCLSGVYCGNIKGSLKYTTTTKNIVFQPPVVYVYLKHKRLIGDPFLQFFYTFEQTI